MQTGTASLLLIQIHFLIIWCIKPKIKDLRINESAKDQQIMGFKLSGV
jgi:hypothetical protein